MSPSRIAIVTGATSGIGRAIAVRLARAGHRVVANGRDPQRLERLVDELGDAVHTVPGDVRDAGSAGRLVDACGQAFGGPPGIAVVNAGRGLPGTLLTSDLATWKELFDVDVIAAMYHMREFAAAMVETPSERPLEQALDVVVLGSSVGRNVSPFNSVYGAAKFAVHGAAEGLRREVGPLGVRVSLVAPAVVDTDFQATAGYDEAWFESYSREIGPILAADDVARVVEFIVEQPPHVHLNEVTVRPTRQTYP